MKPLHLAWIRPTSILLLSLALVCLDFLLGPLVQTPLLYIFPIGLAAWYLGERWSILLALALSMIRAWFTYRYWQVTIPEELIVANLGVRCFAYFLVAESVVRHARLHRLQKNRLDLILEQLPVGVGFTDAEGKIISVNPAEMEIWGGGIEDVSRLEYGRFKGWFPRSEHMLTSEEWALARTLQTGQSVLKEVVDIETFDGARKTILNSTVLLTDEIGRVRGAVFVNQDITEEINREREREALVARLEAALASNRVLKGLLPICASCKKIRDDAGYWNQIEVYLRDHSDLLFSHGICPDCAARLYPEFSRSSPPDAPGS